MNKVDEILGTKQKNISYTTNRNRRTQNYNNRNNGQNNWREQQNKDRQAIYATMDRMALIVGDDSSKFQEYLNVQSRFAKYSVGNCLVILEKAPNSTQIKDKVSWEEKGVSLKENAKAIKILEPNQSNNGVYYNPKKVYDISQTNSPKRDTIINYDTRKLLEALLYDCEIETKSVEKLSDGTIGSEYNKQENILYVCKDMDRETLFQTIFQEMAKIEMEDTLKNDTKNFRSYCASYMMCKRYGIDVSSFNFESLPQEITNQKDAKGIRRELDEIRGNFEKMNERMSDYFEMGNQEKNRSVPER